MRGYPGIRGRKRRDRTTRVRVKGDDRGSGRDEGERVARMKEQEAHATRRNATWKAWEQESIIIYKHMTVYRRKRE